VFPPDFILRFYGTLMPVWCVAHTAWPPFRMITPHSGQRVTAELVRENDPIRLRKLVLVIDEDRLIRSDAIRCVVLVGVDGQASVAGSSSRSIDSNRHCPVKHDRVANTSATAMCLVKLLSASLRISYFHRSVRINRQIRLWAYRSEHRKDASSSGIRITDPDHSFNRSIRCSFIASSYTVCAQT
jgi:hypothetical protein